MALLKWSDEDEEKKQEDLLAPKPFKVVDSVQNSWQPTQDGNVASSAPQLQDENYLMSEQKTVVDRQLQQRKEAEAAAKAEAARQAAIARQDEANARAAAAQEVEVQDSAAKYDGGVKRNEGGFTGFLKDIGSGIQQGLGALGDIAIKGGAVIGSVGKNDQELVRHMESVEKVRGWLGGMKDFNGNNLVGTRDVEAAADDINAGQGDLQDYLAVGGKGLQAGIDATMFANPARMALGATKAMPVVNSATLATRIASNPAVRYAARDAGFYGGLQGVATTAGEYGRTGELDEALQAGATDALVGGALQGTLDMGGHVVGKGVRKGYESLVPVANKTINSLRRPGELRPAVDMVEDAEGTLVPVQDRAEDAPALEDGNVSFESPEQGVPNQVIDLPNPDSITPIADYTPARPTPVADGIADTTPDLTPVADSMPMTPEPMTEWADEYNGVDPRTQDIAVDTPTVPNEAAPSPAPQVADGVMMPAKNIPTVKSEEVRALQESKAGASQAEEAVINQQLNEMEADTPRIDEDPYDRAGITDADDYDTSLQKIDDALDDGRITEEEHSELEDDLFDIAEQNGDAIAADVGDDNLPDNLTPAKAGDEPVLSDKDINKQIANKVMRHTDTNAGAQADLARAVGLAQDTKTDVRTLLEDGGVEGGKAERIATLFEEAAKISESNKAIQKQYRKDFVKSGVDGIDDAPARQRNRETGEAGDLQRQLNSEIRKLQIKGDMKERLLQGFENVVQGRNANMLTSASVVEKSVTADLWATLAYGVKNPIKMARGVTQHGNVAKNAAKSTARGWKDTPKTVTEGYKYLIGNAYHTAMTPAQIAADLRKGAIRTELSKWIYKNQAGKDLTSSQAEKFSRTFGADVEALVNMGAGVENGTISDLAYRRALKDFKKFVESGSEADYANYLSHIDRQNSLAAAMAKGVGSEKLGRFGASVVNALLPYMRNAKNMTVKSFTRDLNPFAKSLVDEIRADQVGAAQNLYNLLKNKAVDYGTLALLASTLEYNDGDDVSKPQGVSIHLGGDNYFPVRGTPIELPLALVAMTKEIVEDTTSGEEKDWQYYAGMIKSSVPYLDYIEQASNVMDSVANIGDKEGDNGYDAKAYGVNLARSLTPFSNNAVMPYVEGKQGNSVDAKKVYDADPLQWYENSLKNAYNIDRDSLETSRDAAGRVRTMDNQGSFINKTINDANTATHNDTITSLVKYGRDSGLGKGTQDMFNTYDTGKNNNFKSVQDTITFLDVEAGGKPDAAKKLENNEKLADLAAQIRDGFYGETGSELLTLNGENLKSDASVPGKSGSKNSKLPLSMQSIKNAVAQTDLPKEQGDKLWEISQAKTALYEQLKAKSMSYDQYSAAKAELEKGEIEILSGSENYKKLGALMNKLDESGFFNEGGIGSTKAGQTYLWNSLNALLGSKGATPAANYPETGKGLTPWGRGGGGGSGRNATNKPGDRNNKGIQWTPVGKRGMATVQSGKYTPVQVKVKLGNAVKKNKTQNYSDRSF
jgi:hypothetical protein